jgi:hypothetical protein
VAASTPKTADRALVAFNDPDSTSRACGHA